MQRSSAVIAAIAVVFVAPIAAAQSTRGTAGTNVNSCVSGANVEQYSNGDVTTTVSKTTGNVYVRDTSSRHEVKTNVGGGSVPMSRANLPKTARVDNGARPDSVKIIAPIKAEQTAVRANVGGGSTAIMHTNQANTMIPDSSKVVVPGSCPTPDVPNRKP
jgi:hypothetical protein